MNSKNETFKLHEGILNKISNYSQKETQIFMTSNIYLIKYVTTQILMSFDIYNAAMHKIVIISLETHGKV